MAAASAHMLPPQTEEDVGMQCFVNPEAKGFTGVLKQRFTDFIVREVDLQGAVCRLTEAPGLYGTPMPSASLSVEKPDSVEEKEGANGDRDAAPSNLSEEERVKAGVASISLALGSELVNGLDKAILLEVMGSLPSSEMKQVFVVPGVGDKDLRRKVRSHSFDPPSSLFLSAPYTCNIPFLDMVQVHTLIREHLGDFVETVTVTEDGASSSIVVRTLGGGNGRKRRRGERSDRPMKRSSTSGQERQRQPWPSTLPPYVKFVIYKENMDSNTAQERIRHCAQVPRGSIGVAGTKDRRAATSQWATVRMRTAHDIVQINREAPRGGRIIVGNFSYVNDALDLGDLMGNRFSITLRNVSSADASNGEELSAILSTACNGVMEKGFINFFGLQRFGSGGSRTSDVGRMILKGNWEGAVQGIMRPREGEAAQVHEAKLHFLNHPDDPAVSLWGTLTRLSTVLPHYLPFPPPNCRVL
jgi:tRNA pseudouridine13 synthase